jgi:hypothetical protein
VGLEYSTELAKLIAEGYDFSIGAACFPEVHIASPSLEHDLKVLKEKVDAGVTFVITSCSSTRPATHYFVDKARAAGSTPDHPGHHADRRLRADQAHHQDVRRDTAGLAAARARRAPGEPARRRRPGRCVRDAAVLRTARPRRAPGIHFYR